MRPQKFGSVFLPAIVMGSIALQPACSRQASEPPMAATTSDQTPSAARSPSWVEQVLRSPNGKANPGKQLGSGLVPLDRQYRFVTPTMRDGKAPHGPTLRAAMIQAVQAESTVRHAVIATAPDNVRADTEEQNLSTVLSSRGIRVQTRQHGESNDVTFRLNGYGCTTDGTEKLPHVRPRVNGAHVEFVRGDVVEWYQNGRLGLEQGFTLKNRPSCRGEEREDAVVLSLDVELERGRQLSAQLMENRGDQWIEVRDAHANVVLRYSDLYAEDANGKPLPAKMQLSGSKLTLRVDDHDATYPVTVDPLIWAQVGAAHKQPAGDAASMDQFGFSVAVSGDHAAVGAPFDDETATDAGAGHIFQMSAQGVWTQQIKILGATPGGQFGFSTAMDEAGGGNKRVVFGAPKDSDMMVVFGTASWFLGRGSAFAADGAYGGEGDFGHAVAISGSRIVVGGPAANGNDGIVHILAPDPTATPPWTTEDLLVGATGGAERFGEAVAIDGDVAVIGAPNGNTMMGTAYVHQRDPATRTWPALGGGVLVASDGATGDRFGASVALSGLTAIVGAPAKSTNTGAAYSFIGSLGMWSEDTRFHALAAITLATGNRFGASVDIVGGLAAIGAPGTSTSAGAVYVLRYSGTWTLDGGARVLAKTPASSELFGISVSIDPSQSRIIVGASGNDGGGGASSGAFYEIIQRKQNGDACLAASECASDFCVDGVCCNSACGGGMDNDCQACATAKGAAANGTCGTTQAGAMFVCRAAAGFCDNAEVCDGASTACPMDGFKSAATVCRASVGGCDPQELCTGAAAACPNDTVRAAGFVCRAAAGGCDQQEVCDGLVGSCPGDIKAPSGTVCRAAAGICDVQETCNGTADACPADTRAPTTTLCRPANGFCDAQEFCDGTAVNCPADAFVMAGANRVCRAAVGACDQQEICDGSGPNCPSDSFQTMGTVCRPAIPGGCDSQEVCTGASAACPTDVVAAAGTVCRMAAGVCDQQEICNGSSGACPGDIKAPAGTTCRISAGICDATEYCNGTADTCPTDVFQPNTTTCRAAAGICDVAEMCSGTAATCPTDAFEPTTTVCRAAIAGGCDMQETCTGAAAACPADVVAAAGTTCRNAAGICDQKEVCNGSSGACPGDIKVPAGVVCRNVAGICDVAETCDGAADTCPNDGYVAMGTTCRASAGICDVAEACSGTAATCPTDAFMPNTTVCRMAAGNCDQADSCTGMAAACPADAVMPFGTMCRASAGACDVAESCDGASGVCPGDSKVPAGVTCRASAGVCDEGEVCNGIADNCPVDAFKPASTTCRAKAGACDIAESCTGTTVDCPTDVVQPATFVCRSSGGICDPEEKCDGAITECPDDAKTPSGTICRASTGVCDPAEICDGRLNDCVADAKAPDGALCPGGTCQTEMCRIESDLVVAAAASPGYNGPTSTLGYTLGVGNIGRSPTTMVVLTLMVPSGTGLITQREDGSVGDGWTCRQKSESSAGVEIECNRPTLGVGENTLVAVGLRPPVGAESVALTATVSSAIFDPVLENNTASLNQSLLSERYAGGGIGCSTTSPRVPASPVGWLLALFGALTLTFRRRRSS